MLTSFVISTALFIFTNSATKKKREKNRIEISLSIFSNKACSIAIFNSTCLIMPEIFFVNFSPFDVLSILFKDHFFQNDITFSILVNEK